MHSNDSDLIDPNVADERLDDLRFTELVGESEITARAWSCDRSELRPKIYGTRQQ